jgi:proline dehydrogenase
MLNKLIAALLPYFPKNFIWLFSKKYIAGENIEQAMEVAKDLNKKGMLTTIDILGEFITDLAEAEVNKHDYLNVIEVAEKNGIKGNYSVKPTMFGLLLDEELCYQHIREIVKKASQHNNFVRIDMEDSPCTDMEIKLYRRIKAEFPTSVGLVLQSYMRRTYQDIVDMLDMHSPEASNNYRLCKGIYVEPKEVAFKKFDEVNQHYLEDLELMFQKNIYVGIATHDKALVEGAYALIKKYNVPKDRFEFQMLLGVTPELRQSIVNDGYRLRVYVPFGVNWFGYSTRRLKENPKMATQIIKGLFFRG